MAIAKVGSTGGSAGAIGYVLREDKTAAKKPEILAGSFGTEAEVKKEFEMYNKLNKRVKNQATHISVSFHPGEHLDAEKKVEFAEKLLEKLDFKNVPYLVVEHHDKEYEHFHIIAGRIRDDGTTVKEWKIAERAIAATKELERDFTLQSVAYTKSNDRRISRSEYKQMERTGELSVITEAKFVIDESLKDEPNVNDFVESLQKSGFDVRPNISESTGKMNGFSFKKDEITFKSSAIGKDYSFQNLQRNGLDYDQARDTEYLIGVKNEFTQKLIDESRGNRGIETPESTIDGTESVIKPKESTINGTESIIRGAQSNLIQSLSIVNQTGTGIQQLQDGNYQPQNNVPQNDISQAWISTDSATTTSEVNQTSISNRQIFEDRSAGDQEKSRDHKTKTSRPGESTDEFLSINITMTEPKLKDAPELEHEQEIEQTRNLVMEM